MELNSYHHNRQGKIFESLVDKYLFYLRTTTIVCFSVSNIAILTANWDDICNGDIILWLIWKLFIDNLGLIIDLYIILCRIHGTENELKDAEHIWWGLLVGNLVLCIWGCKIYRGQCVPQVTNLLLAYLVFAVGICLFLVFAVMMVCICSPIIACLILSQGKVHNKRIINLPVYVYEDAPFVRVDDAQCGICLEEYREDDKLRYLPCNHHLHKYCCDRWLEIDNSCPFCRKYVLEEENHV